MWHQNHLTIKMPRHLFRVIFLPFLFLQMICRQCHHHQYQNLHQIFPMQPPPLQLKQPQPTRLLHLLLRHPHLRHHPHRHQIIKKRPDNCRGVVYANKSYWRGFRTPVMSLSPSKMRIQPHPMSNSHHFCENFAEFGSA